MNWKHYTFIGLLVIGLLSSIVTCVREKNTVKEVLHINDSLKKEHLSKISAFKASNDSIAKTKVFLQDSLETLKTDLKKALTKTIATTKNDSLEKEEIRKGILKFGTNPVKQNQSVLASFYGNTAFDVLDVTESLLEEEKKLNVNSYGIIMHQDTIINVQEITIKTLAKMAKPNFWQRLKDWIIGIVIGGGGAVILLL